MVRILIEREDISYEKVCDSNVGLWTEGRSSAKTMNSYLSKKRAFIHSLHMNPVSNKNLFLEKLAFEQSFRTYCRTFHYGHTYMGHGLYVKHLPLLQSWTNIFGFSTVGFYM
mmetsp:Transcript_21201/g.27316  ORF Transcript_21201/g.27316 Transcript_21201/m.27316 type:complete len:112 (+) Transcript_21201:1796-2131(+)